MAVMAGRNAIARTGVDDLIEFLFAVSVPFFRQTGLKKSPAAPAAEVVGPVGTHINEIFLTNHRLDHKTEVFRNGVSQALTNQLTGVLNREFYFKVPVPL